MGLKKNVTNYMDIFQTTTYRRTKSILFFLSIFQLSFYCFIAPQIFPFMLNQRIMAQINAQPRSNLISNLPLERNLIGITHKANFSSHSTSWIIDSRANDRMLSSSFLSHLSSSCLEIVKLLKMEQKPLLLILVVSS